MVDFSNLRLGQYYNRKDLTALWGYKGHQALSRGVVTPMGTNIIILFVTMEKQSSLTQYTDYISDDYLYWEGEEKGGNNQRIIRSATNQDSIYLFYRHRHHQDFQYMGFVKLESYLPFEDAPFQFIFKISGLASPFEQGSVEDPFSSYSPKITETKSLQLSRIGQGAFRIDLMNLWKACAVSNVEFPEILRASHIKPWRVSNNEERLNPYNGLLLIPTYDVLFDRGFISFKSDGQMMLSKQVLPVKDSLGISSNLKLRSVHSGNLSFLEYHRDVVFKR